MLKNDTFKGYLFVMLSVLSMANVYIFSKASLNLVNLGQFGFYWFGFAIIFIYGFFHKKLNIKTIKTIEKTKIRTIILIGFLELMGTIAFFTAIKTMNNPAIVSFFANSTPVFVTLFGILILKERFTGLEFTGIGLTIFGSFIIAYNPGFEIPSDFYKSLFLIIFSSLSFSFAVILTKKNIKQIAPPVLAMNRTLFLFTASIIYLLVKKSSIIIPSEAVMYISLGSLLGPFLGIIAGYTALKYIEASRSSVLGSSKAMFVLFTAYLYFDKLPTNFQIIGGFFTILGVLLISLGKNINWKKIKIVKHNA